MTFARVLVAGVMLTGTGAGAEPSTPVDYLNRVKPILRERCYACHGALKSEAGLRLDTASAALRGGDSGPAIRPGDVDGSLLLSRISAKAESDRMPPEGEPLTPEQIATLRQWIAQQAVAPANEQPERDPRDHWAFRSPVKAMLPTVNRVVWNVNPVDAWLAREHESRGLVQQKDSDKRLWLRRVTLDLAGVPPTMKEQQAFLADESEEAYEQVVDRLLASPLYGERWGRHWMDVWRYSDWWGLGAEVRNSQKHVWHWRDWIIESLNSDKGYDQMLREMLAADELYPNDLDKLRAGGFLARQYFKFNRTTWLDGVVEHTSKAMLGLTANCAKCHDHKYDPISQVEYYQLRAVFEPYQLRTEAIPGQLDATLGGIPRPFDCNLDAPTYVQVRGDERNVDSSRPIGPGVPAILSGPSFAVEPVTLPAEAHHPGLREFVVAAHLRQAEERVTTARAAFASARKKLDELEAAARAVELAESRPVDALRPEQTRFVLREDFSQARPDVWEMRGGEWSYLDGVLVQSQVGAKRATLWMRTECPGNFEALLKYTPTGGDQWKSVGMVFDATDGNDVLAYVSGFAGGPKAQVAVMRMGNTTYPAESARAIVLELNRPHELVLRVRDQLVNLALDDQPPVAYRLPQSRQRGNFGLVCFDATARLHAFELRELPAETNLIEPTATPSTAAAAPPPMTVPQMRLLLTAEQQAMHAAELEVKSVAARAAADRAKYLLEVPEVEQRRLAMSASEAERAAAAARAEEAVTRAELAVSQAAESQKVAMDQKLATAKAVRKSAVDSLANPNGNYTELAGAYKTLESNVETETSRSKPFPSTSTGRRAAFARWLTDVQNPLTARVAVNHIWARHFGRPLVATVFDFGRKGATPTHPELLDWLAVDLMEHGWKMKRLHRLLVTSQTYRLASTSSGADPATIAADPENRFYWRGNSLRMEAQVVRDSLLHLAGELDLTVGGLPIPVNDAQSRRRSVYFVHSHNDHQQFLAMFDDASVLDCYRRSESIVPQQALALENSELASRMAEKIALRLTDGAIDDAEFLRQAFVLVLGTEPTSEELSIAREGLARFGQLARQRNRPESLARIRLVHALLNHNDFVTIR